jgi:Predicted enzyme related to lactoylglutathione lyase
MSETAAEAMQAMPKHGEFCWTEIATDNLEACKKFYQEVFNWKFEKSDASGMDIEYLEFNGQGGLFEMNPEWYGGETPPPQLNVYIAVDDVDETARRAFDLGGKIVSPPADVPNVGRFCEIEDPTGAKFFAITFKH